MTTGVAPSTLLMNRTLRTRLDMLTPQQSEQQTDNVVETLPSDQDGTSQEFPNVDSQTDAAPEPDMTNSEVIS